MDTFYDTFSFGYLDFQWGYRILSGFIKNILTLEPPGIAVYLKPSAGKFCPRTWLLFLYG